MHNENFENGHIVISAYKPKPGKDEGLLDVLKTHLPILRKENLITDRNGILMRAKDGTYIEVFEWKSSKTVEQAHSNAAVLEMWKKFDEVCEYAKLCDIDEAKGLFAGFEPVNI
jgi:hypothetical protein